MYTKKRKMGNKKAQRERLIVILLPCKQSEKYSIPAMCSYRLEICH